LIASKTFHLFLGQSAFLLVFLANGISLKYIVFYQNTYGQVYYTMVI